MTIKEVKEQLQEDILSILEGSGVEEDIDEEIFEELKNNLCNAVINNLNKLN
jgi:hypothetical protein